MLEPARRRRDCRLSSPGRFARRCCCRCSCFRAAGLPLLLSVSSAGRCCAFPPPPLVQLAGAAAVRLDGLPPSLLHILEEKTRAGYDAEYSPPRLLGFPLIVSSRGRCSCRGRCPAPRRSDKNIIFPLVVALYNMHIHYMLWCQVIINNIYCTCYLVLL